MSTNVWSNVDGTDYPQVALGSVVTSSGPESQAANAQSTAEFTTVDHTGTPVNSAGWTSTALPA